MGNHLCAMCSQPQAAGCGETTHFVQKMTCLQNTQNQQLQISTHNLHACTQSSPFHQGKQTHRPKGHASATAEDCFSFTFKSELAVITQHVSTQAVCYSKGKSSLQSPTSNSTLTTSTLACVWLVNGWDTMASALSKFFLQKKKPAKRDLQSK